MKRIKQRLLQFQAGSSDKVYQVEMVEVEPDRFLVNFRTGRLGSDLRDGSKTVFPVPRDEAEAIFDKLVESKLEKGYADQAPSPDADEPEETSAMEAEQVEEIEQVEEAQVAAVEEAEEAEHAQVAEVEVEEIEESSDAEEQPSTGEAQPGYQDIVRQVDLDAVPTELGSTDSDTELIEPGGKAPDKPSEAEAKPDKKWWKFWD